MVPKYFGVSGFWVRQVGTTDLWYTLQTLLKSCMGCRLAFQLLKSGTFESHLASRFLVGIVDFFSDRFGLKVCILAFSYIT